MIDKCEDNLKGKRIAFRNTKCINFKSIDETSSIIRTHYYSHYYSFSFPHRGVQQSLAIRTID